MLQSLLADRSIIVEHRHGDGRWGRMEGKGGHHDPAAHDPEQEWQYGVVFRCDSCDEEVRLTPPWPEGRDEGS